MNKLQLMLLVSNQVGVIKHGMELCRMSSSARQRFKKAVGLSPRASHIAVLFALGQTFKLNNMEAEFFSVIAKHNANDLITPDLLAEAYS